MLHLFTYYMVGNLPTYGKIYKRLYGKKCIYANAMYIHMNILQMSRSKIFTIYSTRFLNSRIERWMIAKDSSSKCMSGTRLTSDEKSMTNR